MAHRHCGRPHASRILGFILIPIALGSIIGCGHRRNAMRPVYGTPVASPAVVVPAPAGRAVTTEPDPAEPFQLTPIPSTPTGNSGGSVQKAGISPPVPTAAEDEPSMNIKFDPSPSTSPGPSGASEPELTQPAKAKPSSIRGTSGRVIVPRATTNTTAIDRLKPFLGDSAGLLQPSRADRPWKYIVLHHSATHSGGYDQIDHDHRKILGYEGCGYHFVIGNGTDTPDGLIEPTDRWINQKQGVHCRNAKTSDINEYGIGICLVGNFDQTAPTPRQLAAAADLVVYLEQSYRIPTDHVGTHDHFASSPTACPGKNFPKQAITEKAPLAVRSSR